MQKIIHSLQTKLIISFILLITIIAGGIFFFTFTKTKKALLDSTKEDMRQIIGITAQSISQEDIALLTSLQPGQENTEAYIALKNRIANLRSSSDTIINFYVLHIDNGKAIFNLDDIADEPASIGETYDDAEPKLFDAVNGPTVSDDVYTDQWGTFLSAYAPLKNANGETILIIGADMEATKVIQRQNFIGNSIYVIMGIAILISMLIIGYFSLTIIKDINKLNKSAEEISKGNTNVVIDVHRKDEIGALADSFGRMVTSLKIMMGMNDEMEGQDNKNKDK